ncbi:hypothetical protein E2C01_097971 [Portunus trituberculatus]|uniref:Uncharacterized protein n=1 Tax=Portunus trituberculatus TaxID=210409 RepID=A0A5B7K1R8_PORTR|nr:hypothetical protein [Portunus trituberculatus]
MGVLDDVGGLVCRGNSEATCETTVAVVSHVRYYKLIRIDVASFFAVLAKGDSGSDECQVLLLYILTGNRSLFLVVGPLPAATQDFLSSPAPE